MIDRRVPRLCPGGTVVCLASGPSLTTEDVDYVRGKATVIAVNDTVRLAPWADALYSNDQIWWASHYKAMRDFKGLKFRIMPGGHQWTGRPTSQHCAGCLKRLPATGRCWCEGIVTLKNGGPSGLSLEPDTICTGGQNSGSAAINVAVLMGASRVLLLGYDMSPDPLGRRHFYDTGPMVVTSPFMKFRKGTATMVEPLNKAGVEVINCSRRTALDCFPCRPLRDALC